MDEEPFFVQYYDTHMQSLNYQAMLCHKNQSILYQFRRKRFYVLQ